MDQHLYRRQTRVAFADREIQIDRTFHTNDRFVTAVASPALVLARDDFNAIDGCEFSRAWQR